MKTDELIQKGRGSLNPTMKKIPCKWNFKAGICATPDVGKTIYIERLMWAAHGKKRSWR